MYTIATAGHIDHGKSSLVTALTGVNPDRLPEEQRREMTIELGFAPFRLSTGEEVGIIDVPGHERFIKTMIAGVGALDLVMFVIAADDGWMPQSEEHLAILRHLGVERGIIVLTKVDLADADWKELVKSDLRVKTKGTFLEDCEIIEFSAVDNRNLDLIHGKIEQLLKSSLKRAPSTDSARLYVDRVFTIAGTGTVVTGTLREGTLTVGQEVIHHPTGDRTKVKNLESFYSHLETAPPGIRLAVGLQTFQRADVKRGDLLYYPEKLRGSISLGITLSVETKQNHLLKHSRGVIFLHGTSEIDGRIILPPETIANDDGSIIATLQLEQTVITKSGDRFILRLPTPSVLVGGGIVLDPTLVSFKRTATESWQLLRTIATLLPEDLLRYELTISRIAAENDILFQSLVSRSSIQSMIEKLMASKTIIRLGAYLTLTTVWNEAIQSITNKIKTFHQQDQHLASMQLAGLASAVDLPQQLFEYALENLIKANKLERLGAGVRLRDYSAELTPQQENFRKSFMAYLQENPQAPLTREQMLARDKEARKVYAYLKQRQEIIDVAGMIYLKSTFDKFAETILEFLRKNEKITVAQARDVTQTSRNVILPILEELDRQKITKRDGDFRILCQK